MYGMCASGLGRLLDDVGDRGHRGASQYMDDCTKMAWGHRSWPTTAT